MNAYEKIVAYGKELGLDHMSVETLIQSHRAMREAIKVDQKISLAMLEEARQRAYQQVMDSTWVRIEDLKKMSVKELVAMLSDE